MRIAVFGVGSVGGYFGGRLAAAGENVTFIARGDTLRALRATGLKVESIRGDFLLDKVQVEEAPARVGEVDYVILGVKAWQVPEIARVVKPMVGEATCVLPLQNGVEAPDQLAAELGVEHVLGGLCQISAMVVSPGHIRHVGIDPLVVLGELDNRPSQRVECLVQAFQRSEVRAEASADIRLAIWEKFLFIAAIGGVGAVTRSPVGVFRSVPQTRRMLEEVMAETVAVAQAKGIGLMAEAVRSKLAFIDSISPQVIASMQRDIQAEQPSELESLVGAVARLGCDLGVSTPASAQLYASLLPQELRARGELTF
ncbi:MAG: 2-dehydropantoate 2-reductase [Anaerolineales bacterium]|nr:2-dehydropantoate 2-reductase [Anaerolineales bacterium]